MGLRILPCMTVSLYCYDLDSLKVLLYSLSAIIGSWWGDML